MRRRIMLTRGHRGGGGACSRCARGCGGRELPGCHHWPVRRGHRGRRAARSSSPRPDPARRGLAEQPTGSGRGPAAHRRRYGMPSRPGADGLDARGAGHSLLAAERETRCRRFPSAADPLTALSMRLEEVIAAADDRMRSGGRRRGTGPGRTARRRGQPAARPRRRATSGTASLTGIDEIIHQQVVEWEPAFRRAAANSRSPASGGSGRTYPAAGPGAGHAGRQRPDATAGDGRDPHVTEHQVGRHEWRTRQSGPARAVSRIFERA